MLPRLRFVIAALAIALLPWALLGTGAVVRSHDATPIELSGARVLLRQQAMLAGDEGRQLQAFAFARRSEQLEQLRVLASAPLPNWLAAPAGSAAAVEPVAEAAPPAGPSLESVGSVGDETPQTEPLRQANVDPAPAAETMIEAAPGSAEAPEPASNAAAAAPPPPVETTPSAVAAAEVPGEMAAEDRPPDPIPVPQARPQRPRLPLGRHRRAVQRFQVRRNAQAAAAGASNPFASLFNLP